MFMYNIFMNRSVYNVKDSVLFGAQGSESEPKVNMLIWFQIQQGTKDQQKSMKNTIIMQPFTSTLICRGAIFLARA